MVATKVGVFKTVAPHAIPPQMMTCLFNSLVPRIGICMTFTLCLSNSCRLEVEFNCNYLYSPLGSHVSSAALLPVEFCRAANCELDYLYLCLFYFYSSGIQNATICGSMVSCEKGVHTDLLTAWECEHWLLQHF